MDRIVTSSGSALAGIDIAPDHLERVADQLGVPVASACGRMADIHVSSRADAATVRAAFEAGAWCFLQLDGQGEVPDWLDRADLLDAGQQGGTRLVLCLTTEAAFSLDVAVLLCDWLVAHGALGHLRRPEVELAVHEALINAIIHGNLGIRRGPSDDAEGYNSFYAAVREALARPEVACRMVAVDARWDSGPLILEVRDQGAGFDSAGLVPAMPDAKSGRGLQIIREIADEISFADGGRRIRLKFHR